MRNTTSKAGKTASKLSELVDRIRPMVKGIALTEAVGLTLVEARLKNGKLYELSIQGGTVDSRHTAITYGLRHFERELASAQHQ